MSVFRPIFGSEQPVGVFFPGEDHPGEDTLGRATSPTPSFPQSTVVLSKVEPCGCFPVHLSMSIGVLVQLMSDSHVGVIL